MAVSKDKKRENFEVSPEQQAEIDCFKDLVNAPTRKDAVLTAIRLALHLALECRKGKQIFVGNQQERDFTRVIVLGIEPTSSPAWKYLIERPHAWKKQLWVKGRRLPAAAVWTSMLVNHMTVQETAEDWDLPAEAVGEIIRYCEQSRALLEMEALEEKHLLEEKGI